jgi:hypothetical protein
MVLKIIREGKVYVEWKKIDTSFNDTFWATDKYFYAASDHENFLEHVHQTCVI